MSGECDGTLTQLVEDVCNLVDNELPGSVKDSIDTAMGAVAEADATSQDLGGDEMAEVTKATGAAYRKLAALMKQEHPTWRETMRGGPRADAQGRVRWKRESNVE